MIIKYLNDNYKRCLESEYRIPPNGKKVEVAVKKVIEGKTVTNKESLSNPETLNQFRNIPELLN